MLISATRYIRLENKLNPHEISFSFYEYHNFYFKYLSHPYVRYNFSIKYLLLFFQKIPYVALILFNTSNVFSTINLNKRNFDIRNHRNILAIYTINTYELYIQRFLQNKISFSTTDHRIFFFFFFSRLKRKKKTERIIELSGASIASSTISGHVDIGTGFSSDLVEVLPPPTYFVTRSTRVFIGARGLKRDAWYVLTVACHVHAPVTPVKQRRPGRKPRLDRSIIRAKARRRSRSIARGRSRLPPTIADDFHGAFDAREYS